MIDHLEESLSILRDEDLTTIGIVDPIEWKKIDLALGIPVPSSIRNIYKITNGFSNYHQGSQIILWSMDEIVSRNKDRKDSTIRIGDFLIESDYIVIDINLELAPVKMEYENLKISDSIIEFISELTKGKFDFM